VPGASSESKGIARSERLTRGPVPSTPALPLPFLDSASGEGEKEFKFNSSCDLKRGRWIELERCHPIPAEVTPKQAAFALAFRRSRADRRLVGKGLPVPPGKGAAGQAGRRCLGGRRGAAFGSR